MKEHFSSIKDEFQENNNSFIFLEKSSLNLLLAYLLSNNKYETPHIANGEDDQKAIEKIDQLINENEKEFKEIIDLLKDMT